LVNDSRPLFSALFCRCSFHLPARPTSPFDFSCRQALIGERFISLFKAVKSDGAIRTSIHLDLSTLINLVVQAEFVVVFIDTKANRSVFQLSWP
jgi:hypothetical protein